MTFMSCASLVTVNHYVKKIPTPLTYKDYVDPFIISVAWPFFIPKIVYDLYTGRKNP